jgi:PAP2 superfamily protein
VNSGTVRDMSAWAIVAAVYGGALAAAALVRPLRRRLVTISACLAYVLLALGAGTIRQSLWFGLIAPAALLLSGYWLSGLFFHAPQRWLETRLLEFDRRLFGAASVDAMLQRAPHWTLELLEGAYASISLVIAAGAIAVGIASSEALEHFWTVVLAAELSCYVWLPWLRTRPPRALEAPGVIAQRRPFLRLLNAAVLDRGSVHANTLPSGHVAGAVAAALGVLPVSRGLAGIMLIVAAAIALAATAGRYHYAVDCAAGVLVAVLVWSLLGGSPIIARSSSPSMTSFSSSNRATFSSSSRFSIRMRRASAWASPTISFTSSSIAFAVSSLYGPRSLPCGISRNRLRRPSAKLMAPSRSLMPHSVTIARAMSVARCRSFCAPVEISPSAISSAARPPSSVAS